MLAADVGGTELAAALVDGDGVLLRSARVTGRAGSLDFVDLVVVAEVVRAVGRQHDLIALGRRAGLLGFGDLVVVVLVVRAVGRQHDLIALGRRAGVSDGAQRTG